jgi:hypothetical protein
MNEIVLKEWFKLTEDNKRNIFSEVAVKMNLPAVAIEKDWWVVKTLELVFSTIIGPGTVFKGGTSLSKAWGLIDRFSEDIDLALDRSFLGFKYDMTNSQVSKLRRTSCNYISNTFYPLIQKTFINAGFKEMDIQIRDTTSNDQDPLILEVNFPALTDKSDYLQSKVLIEIGSRSLKEPFTDRQFCSMVGEHFNGREFADTNITIPTVNPERTFLEKIFLLHEEYQQPAVKINVNRLSRHLYDLEKLMDTKFAINALNDKNLYQHIVEHRKMLTPLRGIDYSKHSPGSVNIIPPDNMIAEWKKDYELMQQSMFYTKSLSFEKLMERINELNSRINKINF